ncbi:hypothetical protein ACWU4D_18835 [Vibrio sp. WJH972]
MKKTTLIAGLLLSQVALAEPEVLWQYDDFKMPESVLIDNERNQIYVSNINMDPVLEDENGSIGLISADGKSHTVEWVTGLSSPKGLAQKGEYLYIADVKELVVINVDTAQISARYPVPGAGVLNGLAFDKQGDLYVSDWMGNRIYRLKNQELTVWLETEELESPNGLVVKDDYLYVAAWGKNPKSDFSTEESGLLKRISLSDKHIENLPDDRSWNNLDGLHPLPNGWLATDFLTGELLTLNNQGKIVDRELYGQTSADFWLDEKHNLLLVPYMMSNRVAAYRYEEKK